MAFKLGMALALASFVTAACSKSPAEECLDSFRASLKDPESGRVINFSENTLVYTATNSYGARTQGKAICANVAGKWSRDRATELIVVVRHSGDVLTEYNNCRQRGGTKPSCAGSSTVLKHAGVDLDLEELYKESARTLGFQ